MGVVLSSFLGNQVIKIMVDSPQSTALDGFNGIYWCFAGGISNTKCLRGHEPYL